MDYKVLNVRIDSYTIKLERHTEYKREKKDMVVLIYHIGKTSHQISFFV